MHHSLLEWGLFVIILIILITIDLGIFSRKDRSMSFKQSILLSIFYIAIACLFGIYVYYQLGAQSTKEYFTGYLIEKAMSLDNIFVISVIFNFFAIPSIYQHRVLIWGILGVIIFRAIMIGVGSSLIANFSWLLYIFAILLIFTGIKIIYLADRKFNVSELPIYKFLQKHLNLTSEIEGHKFFVKKVQNYYATPLFTALIIIETMDLVFAIDSLPAIFAITTDPYIIYTSNIFAILGLRALFFCLNDIIHRFKYLKYFLGLILIFIGIKIFLHDFIHIPVYVSLLTTILLLVSGIIVSLVLPGKPQKTKNYHLIK